MEEVKDEVQKDPVADHPSTPTTGAPGTPTCAAQLSSAAEALERVIGKLEAQYEALNQKIDRIIATVEKQADRPSKPNCRLAGDPEQKSGEAAVEASAQAEAMERVANRCQRKTLPAVVNTWLAKSGVGEGMQVESSTLDRALGALTIEQRIAVKAELARAGMIA